MLCGGENMIVLFWDMTLCRLAVGQWRHIPED